MMLFLYQGEITCSHLCFVSAPALALFLNVCLEVNMLKNKNSIPKDIFLCWLYISFLLHLQVQVIKWIDVAFIKLWRSGVLLCEYHFIYSIWIGKKKSFVCFQQPFVHTVKCTDRAFWQNHRKFSAEYLISS